MTSTSAAALAVLARSIADRDWAGLRAVLADDVRVTLLHTGETFDADGFVAFNRGYPGDWAYHAEEVVDGGHRAVLRSRTVVGDETYHAASFATVDGDGRIVELREVWTEAVAPHPERG